MEALDLPPAYEPLVQSREEYLTRIKEHMQEVEEAVEATGAIKVPRKHNLKRDMEWLVRRVVLGEAPSKIALRYDNQSEAAGIELVVTDTTQRVEKAVQRAAKLIGLLLPQGRPT